MNHNRARSYEKKLARERGWVHTDAHLHDVRTNDGRLVEMKTCKVAYPSGRTGRWRVFRERHEGRRTDTGDYSYYLVALDNGEIEYETWVSVGTLDQFLSEWQGSWQDNGGHACGSAEAKITWRSFRDWYEGE